MEALLSSAVQNISNLLKECFGVEPSASSNSKKILIVYDEQTPLAQLISLAYKTILSYADQIVFNQENPQPVLQALESLNPDDLVILIQSTNFRLDAFRLRVHLFSRNIRVIEHPHLGRVGEDELKTYVESLAYDRNYYHHLAPALKKRLDVAKEVRLEGARQSLVYQGPFEEAKLNIGNYSHLKNVGGQFPIGEVFTELKDLNGLNGQVAIFAFGDKNFSVFDCESPIVLEIRQGRVVQAEKAPPEFLEILTDIKNLEGEVWVRELGFGLNPALTRKKRIKKDVGIYERMLGVHLSLGGKHTLYPKPGFSNKKVRYHVDIFVDLQEALIDGECVYRDGSYI